MRISIITVVLNAATTIEDTLHSVAEQRYPDVEHIVVDGASSDGTIDLIRRHQNHLARFVSEPDRGIYDAMNKGIELARGEVIGFLNAGDIYANANVLQWVAETLADPDVDACYADLVYVDAKDTRKVVRYWRSRPYETGLFRTGWMPAHPTFFVKRKIYERYGKFDLDFQFQSDFDLTMRFLEVERIRSVYVPKIFVRMRTGGATNAKLSNIARGNIEAYRARKKYFPRTTPFFIVRKILSRFPQFFVSPPESDRRRR